MVWGGVDVNVNVAVGGVGVMVGGMGVEQNKFTTPNMQRTIRTLTEGFIPTLAFEIDEGYITFILLLFDCAMKNKNPL